VELEVVQRSRVGAMLIFVLLLFWRRGRLLVGGYADVEYPGVLQRGVRGSCSHFGGIIEIQTYKLIYKSIPVLRPEVDKILRY
jgi:hypothetical protein